jgi:L-alanine-DL-glutamate epimerase-like enolase superfamily enzyme
MSLRLETHPYRLQLRRPWRTARGRCEVRVGWLVRAEADGITGFGDCAPLPAAGTEGAAQAERRLQHWREGTAPGADALLTALADGATATPAADCAVETALLDLAARRAGLPLRRMLAPDAPDRVEVNAMLGPAATLVPIAVEHAVAAGFRVLKLKVGTAGIDVELPRIRAAAALLPSAGGLRLDANGAWDEATAAVWIDALAGLPIDGLEEPLTEPDWAALARLQAAAPFSLALDESLGRLRLPGLGRDALAQAGMAVSVGTEDAGARPSTQPTPGGLDWRQLPVRRLVLKPAALGGLRRTLRLARVARAGGREVVVTSIVESAAGLWPTAQLAAASGSRLAHGLATADWLASDLGTPPVIEQGAIRLPESSGSGFEAAS